MEYMKKAGFIAGLMLLTLFAACGDDNSSSNNASIASLVQTSTTAYVGEPYHIGVIVSGITDFSASVDQAGLACEKSVSDVVCNATASGEYVVTVTATTGSKNSKTATVTVPDLAFRYGTEDGDELPFFADDDESGEITFNAAGPWTADVQDDPSWITLTCSSCVDESSVYETVGLYEDGDNGSLHLEGGAGNNTIIINLQLNRSGEERAAIILIAANGKTIELTVLQKAERANGTVPNKYEAPEDISVEVYDGETLKATITTDDLNEIQQEIVVSAGRNYVAYAITDVLEYLDCELSTFTRILYDTSDDYPVTRDYNNFENAYIAIGYIAANDSFIPETDGVRALPEGADTTNGGVVKFVNRITVNPIIEEPDPGETDPCDENECEAPADLNIDVFDGKWLLATITADVLNELEYEIVTTSNGREWVAYAISDILDQLDCDPSDFTEILYEGAFYDYSAVKRTYGNFNNAYIAIGYFDGGSYITANMPRFLPDGAGTASGNVVRAAARITVNPLAELENDYEVPAYILIDVYDGDTLLTTITAADLEEIQQRLVFLETINATGNHYNREYVAYPIADVMDKLGFSNLSFTGIEYAQAGGLSKTVTRTSFARAYIAIGYLDWDYASEPGRYTDSSAPRFIYDSLNLNNSPGSHGEIVQNGDLIKVNP